MSNFTKELTALEEKQDRTQSLIDEAVEKNARLEAMRETYRVAQENRDKEILERRTRLSACNEIMDEMKLLLPRIEVLVDALKHPLAEDGEVDFSTPTEILRWRALETDYNRVYHARGARRTTPMKWED